MKLFTSSQIKRLDKYTIMHEPISPEGLMERAAGKFVERLVEDIDQDRRIILFAGPGNNGGDALVAEQILTQKGYNVVCLSIRNDEKAEKALAGIRIEKSDIVIDGLFGSGLNRPVEGIFAQAIERINNSEAIVYAIDIPSGLFGEDNTNSGLVVNANYTFSFQFPKLAFLFPENEPHVGQWEILDIGLHPDGIAQTKTPYHYILEEEAARLIRKRSRFAYKNQFGHALIAAGSKGKIGAAVLCAKACLRAGAGLLTVHVPAEGEPIIQTAFPEAMTVADQERDIVSSVSATDSYAAIGVGPGMGTDSKSALALENLFRQYRKPMVIDADALNMIVQNKQLQDLIPLRSILTPHVGEFDRLAGKSKKSYERLQKAREMAVRLRCMIVLKGAYSAVCMPDGEVCFNSNGNPGMATAGSGDVLTGILTGLLSQGYCPEQAAVLGVYLHGRAGDRAAKARGEMSLIASDIISYL